MSLINEALKRAETQKRLNSPENDVAPKLPPVYAEPPRRRIPPTLAILLGAGLAAAVVGAWVVFGGRQEPIASSQAAVAEPPPLPQAAGPVTPQPAEPGPRSGSSPEAELAYAKTVEALTYYEPPPHVRPVGAATQPGDAVAAQQAAPGEDGAAAGLAAATSRSSPPATSPSQVGPAPQAPPKPKPEELVMVDFSKFKLNGIMYSSDGGSAIINGQLVQAGDVVEEATVVKIHPQSVEMQIETRRFRIRM